jgi:predicted transcriptional regulator
MTDFTEPRMDFIKEVSPLTWAQRLMSVPLLPQGLNSQKEHLVQLLNHIDGREPADWLKNAEAVMRVHLRITGLKFTQLDGEGKPELTPLGTRWLETENSIELFYVLHNTTRLFGEILDKLNTEKGERLEDLLALVEAYHTGWETTGPLRERVGWLHSLGLVEDGPERFHWITSAGKKALDYVGITSPEVALGPLEEDATPLPPVGPLLAARMENSDWESKASALDFVTKTPVTSLARLVELTSSPFQRESLLAHAMTEFDLSASSAKMLVEAGRHFGLYEYISKNVFRATPLGQEFREASSEIYLVRLMHAQYKQFGELLTQLSDVPISNGEIHTLVSKAYQTDYKLTRTATVLKRLREAGAVSEIGWARYALTPLGKKLSESLVLQPFASSEEAPLRVAREELMGVKEIRQELDEASRDINNFERFEKAITQAFRMLDVAAEHLGGPGKTDVGVVIHEGLNTIGSFIIDAKTAASGSLREDSVDFDSLNDHAKKLKYDYQVVVAPGYKSAGRLPARAAQKQVQLLTAQELADLVEEHFEDPFSPSQLKGLLLDSEKDRIRAEREVAKTERATIELVLHQLLMETESSEAEPISARDIRRASMNNGERSVSTEEVAIVLESLAHPWIKAVSKPVKDGYVLAAPVHVAALRLRALADLIESVSSESEGA